MAQKNKQNSRTAEHLTFKLDQAEGPLDLLLHLIKQNEMDIYDIPGCRNNFSVYRLPSFKCKI